MRENTEDANEPTFTVVEVTEALGLSYWSIWWYLRGDQMPKLYRTTRNGIKRVLTGSMVRSIYDRTCAGRRMRRLHSWCESYLTRESNREARERKRRGL
jgi:hypothetical protein